MQEETDKIQFVVPAEAAGGRLELFLRDALPLETESFVRHLLSSGNVMIDGAACKAKHTLSKGETISVEGRETARRAFRVRAIVPDVLYEDAHVLVLNKPAGCTVVRRRNAGACAFQDGILAYLRRSEAARTAAMREHYRPRAVHRLDRDTTGAIIEAKSRAGELHLARQFQERTIGKEYLAVIHGELARDRDEVDAPIRPVRGDLARMEIGAKGGGKPSVTEYEVMERFRGFALIRAWPRTGRRHQIRIHLAHIGHPIAGDEIYGGGSAFMLSSIKRRYRTRRGVTEKPLIARPALHASALTFLPVGTAERLRVEARLPHDLALLLKMLRKYGN